MPKDLKILWEGKHPDYPGKISLDDIEMEDEYTKVRLVQLEDRPSRKNRHGMVVPEGYNEKRGEWVTNAGGRQVMRLLVEENAILRKALESIKYHQAYIGGSLGEVGSTYHIANNALEKTAKSLGEETHDQRT